MAKRGRKRKAGARTPSGLLSRAKHHIMKRKSDERAETERQAMETAIAARARLYSLPESVARSEKAATVVGRMRLTNTLSEVQYQAAVRYALLRHAYLRAIDTSESPAGAVTMARMATGEAGPDDTPHADRFTRVEETDADHAERVERTVARWDAAREAIMDVQIRVRVGNLPKALDCLVIRDEYHEHMEGDLKLALNALARLWDLDRLHAA